MAAVVIVSHWMVLMAGSTCSRVTQDDLMFTLVAVSHWMA